MKRFFYILIAAVLTLSAVTVSAQESTTPKVEPVDSLTMLDNRITKLEQITSKLPHVSGFIQTMFSWQDGYGAFSVSPTLIDKTIKYIRSQEEHHRKQSLMVEYKAFLDAYQIEYDEQYIFTD